MKEKSRWNTKHQRSFIKDLIGSPIHLKRLLMNIMSNAVKYNKDYGKIYLSSKEISSEQDEIVTLEFKCQDTELV